MSLTVIFCSALIVLALVISLRVCTLPALIVPFHVSTFQAKDNCHVCSSNQGFRSQQNSFCLICSMILNLLLSVCFKLDKNFVAFMHQNICFIKIRSYSISPLFCISCSKYALCNVVSKCQSNCNSSCSFSRNNTVGATAFIIFCLANSAYIAHHSVQC